MVITSAKVVLVGAVGNIKEFHNKKTGELFYTMSLAVKRPTSVMLPNGKVVAADWYTVVSNHDCSTVTKGNYLKVTGSLGVNFYPAKDGSGLKQNLEVRADDIEIVQDDTKKEQPKRKDYSKPLKTVASSSLG